MPTTIDKQKPWQEITHHSDAVVKHGESPTTHREGAEQPKKSESNWYQRSSRRGWERKPSHGTGQNRSPERRADDRRKKALDEVLGEKIVTHDFSFVLSDKTWWLHCFFSTSTHLKKCDHTIGSCCPQTKEINAHGLKRVTWKHSKELCNALNSNSTSKPRWRL